MPRDLHGLLVSEHGDASAVIHREECLLERRAAEPMTYEPTRDAEQLVIALAGRNRRIVPRPAASCNDQGKRTRVLRQERHQVLSFGKRAHRL